jgi:hypothetical protein
VNVLEKAASIVDPEAFDESQWFDSNGRPLELDALEKARREYHRSKAICKALDVLKLALKCPNLREELLAIELDDWDKLGVPMRNFKEAREIVEEKYA